MPDKFESEVQRFVSKQNGGELTPNVVYQMLKAVDEDATARHEELVETFTRHCVEANVRDARLDQIEEWVRHCDGQVLRMISSEYEKHHLECEKNLCNQAALRKGDEVGSDYRSERSGTVRSPRYTKEQIVTTVILSLSIIAANAAVTWAVLTSLRGLGS